MGACVRACVRVCVCVCSPSLRVVESTTSYTFQVQTGGIFLFPWHRNQIDRDRRVLVSVQKDTGKAG